MACENETWIRSCGGRLWIGALLLLACTSAAAARTYVVACEHLAADDNQPGTEESPLKTIHHAAQLAQPGDTVLVHGGLYRERVAPARGGEPGKPIVYTAAPGAQVILRGSEVWQPMWEQVGGAAGAPIYAGKLDERLFANERIHPFRTALKAAPGGKHLTLGQVFVDGLPMRETDNWRELLDTPATWMATDAGQRLTIHFPDTRPPTERLVEITVRDRIFAPHRRGLGYLHVRGFTMEHCANQFPDEFWRSESPQAGALGCRAGHHWLIEDNTVRFAKSIGLDCGYEGSHDLEGTQPTPRNSGHHLIRNNRVTDNGCCGIAGMQSTGTQIVDNVVERNNWNGHTAPEIAGIKVHYFVNGRITGNLVRDNLAHGIWIDNVYNGARVARNLIVANRGNGIFVELGEGPILIDNNVVALTKPGLNEQDPRGDGIYSHDASGLYVLHNLVLGSDRFGAFHRKVTQRKGAGASRIHLLNNLFLDNRGGHLNLPYPGRDARDNRCDYNLFSPRGTFLINHWGGNSPESVIKIAQQATQRPVKLWNDVAPRLNLDQWRQVMDADGHSLQIDAPAAHISDEFQLTMNLGKMLDEQPTLPWEGLDRDYLDQRIPSHGALAGPFQRGAFSAGPLKLWPRPASPLQVEHPSSSSSEDSSTNRWHWNNPYTVGSRETPPARDSFTGKFGQLIFETCGHDATATDLSTDLSHVYCPLSCEVVHKSDHHLPDAIARPRGVARAIASAGPPSHPGTP